MEIVYVAHTKSGVFMLDEEGICRWAVAVPGRQEKVPERIVGAQYLAALDLSAPGGIVDFPRVGCPMLFAATDDGGRVRLVRTPPLLRFEERRPGVPRTPLGRTPSIPPVDDDHTPISPNPLRPSSIPPPPSSSLSEAPIPLVRPPTLPPTSSVRTPLPPPPRARIVPRIPPAPGIPANIPGSSGIRPTPQSAGPRTIPSRVQNVAFTMGAPPPNPREKLSPLRSAPQSSMSLRKLARGPR